MSLSTPDIPIAYFTSCRELRAEGVGATRVSLVETLVNEAPLTVCGRRVRVIAIIVDDDDDEFKSAWKTPLWNLRDLPRGVGNLARQAVSFHRVSTRAVRSNAADEPRGSKSARRDNLELQLLEIIRLSQAEFVVCDSYMTVFGPTFLAGAKAVLLNLHPGLTAEDHPARATGPTPTRDAYTRAKYGFVIIDDKARTFWPGGDPIEIFYEGRARRAIRVPPIAETGVAAHLIARQVDRGEVIFQSSYCFDPARETETTLRTRNYALKPTVLAQALARLSTRPAPPSI